LRKPLLYWAKSASLPPLFLAQVPPMILRCCSGCT
jgi:hypothetical protein